MSAEDRLRTALHAAADDTPVDPASYDRIERRTVAARRRRRGVGGGLAAVALVAVAVAVPLALRDDGGEPVQTGPASDTRDTTTTTSSTTTTTEPGTTERLWTPSWAWPALDGDRQFTHPEEAAIAFGTEYLGMAPRPVAELLPEATEGAARVALRPRPEGGGAPAAEGPVTVLDLSQLPSGRPQAPHWFVLHATSGHVTVTQPALGATITSPVHVEGLASNLFEGNVIVEVRDEAGGIVATTNTTARGTGPETAPFSVDVPFDAAGTGAIVVKSDSGTEGTPEATIVPVTFGPATAEPTTEVTVYLVDAQQDFVPATRQVPRTTGVLRAALLELLGGTTPEEQALGLTSPFDDDADILRGVTITDDGTAVVDLDAGIVDALAGADGAAVLGSLDRTVFQFPSVTWVRYTVGGGCGDFAGIGTDLLCERRSRDQY